MKTLTVLFSVVLSQSAWSQNLPCAAGEYAGVGHLIRMQDGAGFGYDASLTIDEAGKKVTSTYIYPDGRKTTFAFTYQLESTGRAKLRIGKQIVGVGHCLGQTCRFDINYPKYVVVPVRISLSYTCTGNQIITTGMNYITNRAFEDVLTRKTAE